MTPVVTGPAGSLNRSRPGTRLLYPINANIPRRKMPDAVKKKRDAARSGKSGLAPRDATGAAMVISSFGIGFNKSEP
jgi:hypothetical protein